MHLEVYSGLKKNKTQHNPHLTGQALKFSLKSTNVYKAVF